MFGKMMKPRVLPTHEHLKSALLSKNTYITRNEIKIVHNTHQSNLTVSFRGIINKADLRNCLDVEKKLLIPDTYVHSGFLKSFMKHCDAVRKEIDTTQPTSVVFCGHSKGGCVAKIAAVYFKYLYDNLHISCHCFGSPKVGDDAFVYQLQSHVNETFNMLHSNDVIGFLPPHYPNEMKVLYNSNDTYSHGINRYIRTITQHLHHDSPLVVDEIQKDENDGVMWV